MHGGRAHRRGSEWPCTDLCCCCCITSLVIWHHSNTPTDSVTCDSMYVGVVVVVSSLTLTHCQGLPQIYGTCSSSLIFITGLYVSHRFFCYIFGYRNGGRLICGTAYTRVYTVIKTKWNNNYRATVQARI